MDKNNNTTYGELDFEKMNAILANPDFANWYYNEIVSKTDNIGTLEDFVQVVKDYSQNQYQ